MTRFAIIFAFCLIFLRGSHSLAIETASTTIEPEDETTTTMMSTMTTMTTTTTTAAVAVTTAAAAMDGEDYLNYTRQGQTDKCAQLMVKSDGCVQEALFIGKTADEILMPKTLEDIDYYCDKLKVTMQCMAEYRSCLKMMPKTLYGIMTRDAKKTLKTICTSPESKKEALDHLRCFRKDKLDFYYSMLNGYTNVMVHLSKPEIELDQLIGDCCCAFHLLYNDSVNVINNECSAVTGMETGLFVGGLVRTMASSAIDIVCAKFNSLPVCKELKPKEMKKYHQLMLDGQKRRFSFSLVIPLVKILNNLDTVVNV